jgi:hypothetical protein
MVSTGSPQDVPRPATPPPMAAVLERIAALEVEMSVALANDNARPASVPPPSLRWRRATAAFACWLLVALVVSGVGPLVATRTSTVVTVLFEIAAILAGSGLLATPFARARGLAPSPWTGAGWLTLAIATEVAVAAQGHAGWSPLLGTTGAPWVRNALLVSWLVGPLLFSRDSADHR